MPTIQNFRKALNEHEERTNKVRSHAKDMLFHVVRAFKDVIDAEVGHYYIEDFPSELSRNAVGKSWSLKHEPEYKLNTFFDVPFGE